MMEFRFLDSLDEHWDMLGELNESSFEPSPFLTPTYLRTWDRCFSAKMEKLVVAGSMEGTVRGAGIFYLREKPSTYFLLGGKSLSDRLGFIIERGYEGAFLEGFFPFIRGVESLAGARFVMNSINGENPQAEILLGMGGPPGGVRITKVDSSPYIDLLPTYDEYLMSLSGKSRHELRRKMRRAEENFGGLHVEVVDGSTRGDVMPAMDGFVKLHRASNTGKLNFWKGKRREFFDAIAREFAKERWLKIFFLMDDARGERVAALMVFDYGGDYLLYNSGFDPARGRSSPGLVLIGKAIEHAVSRGKRRFDFLRGEERYKYDLGSRDRPVYRVEFDT